LLDAASVTFKGMHVQDGDLTELHELLLDLGLPADEASPMDHGHHGYRAGLRVGKAVVLYDGQPGMGVHLSMMGEACGDYAARHGVTAWQHFARQVLARGGTPTRGDLAIDDFTGAVTVDQMLAEARAGRTRTRARKAQHVTEFDLAGDEAPAGAAHGGTLYIGKRTSRVMVRAYDKGAQQGTAYPWLRVELELKRERAAELFHLLAADRDPGELAAGFLRDTLAFVQPTGDSNRARWPLAAWWDAWLGDVARLKFTALERVARSLEETRRNLERQYAPALAAIAQAAAAPENFLAWVRSTVREGAARMKDHHHAMVDEARRIAQEHAELAAARAELSTQRRIAYAPA
jgi:phage replication initiation protein